jgi:signal transduction histidine kinase
MGVVRRPFGIGDAGGPQGLDPVAARRVIDAAAYVLALAVFFRFGDTEILVHAMWVTLAIGAFVYGLRIALIRIAIAGGVIVGYDWVTSSMGFPVEIEPLDFAEWPLMIGISVVVAVMADLLSSSAKRYASLYRQASDRLHTAHEDERAKLARDLHDGVGQTLTAVVLTLDAAQAALWSGSEPPPVAADISIRRAQSLATSALEETRDVAARLRPTRIHEIGLGAALRNLGDAAGLPVAVRFDPQVLPAGLLDADREIDVYRIVQEAIGNAARHSRADHVWIDAVVTADSMRIVIGDDGIGFDPSAERRGLGLDGMRERAAILEGSLDVDTRPGAGTTIFLSVPLPPGAAGVEAVPAVVAEPAR